MNMEHRQCWKNSMYEASSRVPLIIVPPEHLSPAGWHHEGSVSGDPVWSRGSVVNNLTSLLDVYPTILEMAQVGKMWEQGGRGDASADIYMPGFLSGHSLFPFLYRDNGVAQQLSPLSLSTYPNNRSVISQYHSNMGNTGSFMIRSGPWKYIAFGRYTYDRTYKPQLFNVDADPQELHDLAGMPGLLLCLKGPK